jgi:hypothetical protein
VQMKEKSEMKEGKKEAQSLAGRNLICMDIGLEFQIKTAGKLEQKKSCQAAFFLKMVFLSYTLRSRQIHQKCNYLQPG